MVTEKEELMEVRQKKKRERKKKKNKEKERGRRGKSLRQKNTDREDSE